MSENKGILTFGATAGLVVYFLQLLIAKIARQSIISLGNAQAVGQKVTGLFGFDLMTMIYFMIGGAVLVFVGMYLMKVIPIRPSTQLGRGTLLLVYAAIISSLILTGTLGLSIATFVPLVINAVISAFIILKVFEMLNIKVQI